MGQLLKTISLSPNVKKSDPLNLEGKKADVTHIPPFGARNHLIHAF